MEWEQIIVQIELFAVLLRILKQEEDQACDSDCINMECYSVRGYLLQMAIKFDSMMLEMSGCDFIMNLTNP